MAKKRPEKAARAKGKPASSKRASKAHTPRLPQIFLSYHFEDEAVVAAIHQHLEKQTGCTVFFYRNAKAPTTAWKNAVQPALERCHLFVLFRGNELGETQRVEAVIANGRARGGKCSLMVVQLPGGGAIQEVDLGQFIGKDPVRYDGHDSEACAKEIVAAAKVDWIHQRGVPDGYVFDYEKDIIVSYIRNNGQLPADLIAQGCPAAWPTVKRHLPIKRNNPVKPWGIGDYRDVDRETEAEIRDPLVLASAASGNRVGKANPSWEKNLRTMAFPEAGPRKGHAYPRTPANALKVGVLVSGGIAPGINAVIAGLLARHRRYAKALGNYDARVYCYREGFRSLLQPRLEHETVRVSSDDWLDKWLQPHLGGSLLPTARVPRLAAKESQSACAQEIVRSLQNDGVEILYVIGGDGSLRAAHVIQATADEMKYDLSVIGVPKATDNDILWVWQSFGFLSSVEYATGVVRHLHLEAKSNPRVCLVQLFGSDSGFVVCHAALASGVCDLVLIPEVGYSTEAVIDHIQERLRTAHSSGSPHGMVLMAETWFPTDVNAFIAKANLEHRLTQDEHREVKKFVHNRRVEGQTPDELRQAALKIATEIVRTAIREMSDKDPYWNDFRVFDNQPRHTIRAIPPIAQDIIYGERLGMLAVDCAMAGYRDFMISQWLTEYVMVPLELVVLGRKRVPPDGIFWKSVIASTGQPIGESWRADANVEATVG